MAFSGRLGTARGGLGKFGLGNASGDPAFDGNAFDDNSFASTPTPSGGTVSDTFTADAVLLDTISDSFTADSILLDTTEDTFTADAVLTAGSSDTFTADAVLFGTIEDSFTADATLFDTIEDTFVADSVLLDTVGDFFTADAVIVQTPGTGSFTADALLLLTASGSFTADAILVTVLVLDDFDRSTSAGEIGQPSDAGHYGHIYYVNGSVNGSYLEVPSGQNDAYWNYGPSSSKLAIQFDYLVGDPDDFHYYQVVFLEQIDMPGDPTRRLYGMVRLYDNGGGDWYAAYGFGTNFTAGNPTPYYDYTPDAQSWYTFKGYVDYNSSSLSAYGKTWKRGTAEPSGWNWYSETDNFSGSTLQFHLPPNVYVSSGDTQPGGFDNFSIKGLDSNTVDNFTADAWIFGPTISSFTADALLLAVTEDSFTADAALSTLVSDTFTADALLTQTVWTPFSAFSILKGEQGGSFTADAYLIIKVGQTFTANAVLSETTGQTFTADAFIYGTFGSFTADAVISEGRIFTADSILLKTILWDAAPSIRSVGQQDLGTAVNRVVTMPTNEAGDLILVAMGADYSANGVFGAPAGWTEVDQQDTDPTQSDFVLYSKISDGNEPSSYTFTYSTGRRVVGKVLVIRDHGGIEQIAYLQEPGGQATFYTDSITTKWGNALSIVFAMGDNNPTVTTPSGWTISGSKIGSTNIWISSYYKDSIAANTLVGPVPIQTSTSFMGAPASWILEISQEPGVFTADAVLHATSWSFTADAVIVSPTHTFTADAVIQKSWSFVFVAFAYLISSTTSDTFTADSVLTTSAAQNTYTFTANAVLFKPVVLDGPTGRALRKTTSLQVSQRRERPLDAYVPPRIPDEEEQDKNIITDPPNCLPECIGEGAGFGSIFGPNGAALRKTIGYCANCDASFFFSESPYLGRDSGSHSGHACCQTTHNKLDHKLRMWVEYFDIPQTVMEMRAKLKWKETNGFPDSVTIQVYGNIDAMPTLEQGECMAYTPQLWLDFWNGGEHMGDLVFNYTGGDGEYYWDDTPAALLIDPDRLTTSIFRFQLSDESNAFFPEFRAGNVTVS